MVKLGIDKIKNWIYVTGLIRSGTTFAGKILSAPVSVDYIHEPFNPECGLPSMKQKYRYIRPSLDTKEMQQYHQAVQSIFRYDFTMKHYTPSKDPWSRKLLKSIVGSRGAFYLQMAKLNPWHTAAVIKDPTGNLLTEYLYLHFGVKPVVIVKHPTSLIASFKRVNWWPQLSEISDQPHLIEDYFSEELDFINRKWSNPLLGSAAYWRATYKVLLKQASKYPDWQVITHEQLSHNPVLNFKNLYEKLNLPWSESVKHKIIKLTQGNQSTQARKGRVQDFNRNSADIFKVRRQSLSLEERKAIFEIVEDVALQIYSRESFDID